jgi:DNA-binding MltR family transcriptional regulator
MTWLSASELDKAIIQEIEAQTDRAAALIATAYLEERLRSALDARTHRHTNVEEKIYRSSGPLGSFSAKIDMALLLGIIEPQVHKFLHTIKDIRNVFAHQAAPRDFNTQKLKDLSLNLTFSADIHITTTGDHAIDFLLRPDGTPRTAFMNAIKLLILALDMEIKTSPPRRPPPPLFSFDATQA